LESLEFPGLRIAVDIRESAACERAVQLAVREYGRIDGIVNAAGVVAFGPLVETTDKALEALFDTNVLGPLRLIRAALPHMRKGFIVNISAVVVERPMPGLVAYCATKGALSIATRALALEAGLRGVEVNCIDARPPHTETGLAQRPISGRPPKLARGLDPERVAKRIVAAIEDGESEIAGSDF
jgi:cyclic-di-GMP-binding biofilm dispersal mediator protein